MDDVHITARFDKFHAEYAACGSHQILLTGTLDDEEAQLLYELLATTPGIVPVDTDGFRHMAAGDLPTKPNEWNKDPLPRLQGWWVVTDGVTGVLERARLTAEGEVDLLVSDGSGGYSGGTLDSGAPVKVKRPEGYR